MSCAGFACSPPPEVPAPPRPVVTSVAPKSSGPSRKAEAGPRPGDEACADAKAPLNGGYLTLRPTADGRWVLDDGAARERIWELTNDGARLRYELFGRSDAEIVEGRAIYRVAGGGIEMLELATGKVAAVAGAESFHARGKWLFVQEKGLVRRLDAKTLGEAGRVAVPSSVTIRRLLGGDLVLADGFLLDFAASAVVAQGELMAVAREDRRLLFCTETEMVDFDVRQRRVRTRLPVPPHAGPCWASGKSTYVGADSEWLASFHFGDQEDIVVEVTDVATGRAVRVPDRTHQRSLFLDAQVSVDDPQRFCLFAYGKFDGTRSCDWLVRGGRPVPSRDPRPDRSPGAAPPGRTVIVFRPNEDGTLLATLTGRPAPPSSDGSDGTDLRVQVTESKTGRTRLVKQLLAGRFPMSFGMFPGAEVTFLDDDHLLVEPKGDPRFYPRMVVDVGSGTVRTVPAMDIATMEHAQLVFAADGGLVIDARTMKSTPIPQEAASSDIVRRIGTPICK